MYDASVTPFVFHRFAFCLKGVNMRLLLVGWSVEPEICGGLDIHVSRIAERLGAFGHSVFLCVPDYNAHTLHLKDALLWRVDAGKKPERLYEFVRSVTLYNRNVFYIAKNTDFDIIHTHDWLGAEAGMLVKEKLGKKWIHTVHSLEYMRSGGVQPFCDAGPIEKAEEIAIRNSDLLLTVSVFMQKEINKRYKRKAKVIHNAPSLTENQNRVVRENQRILYVGRLSEQKGVRYLIYSVPNILERFPSAKLVISGEGHLRKPLERFAESLGIEKSVVFLGFVSKKRLTEEYQKATLFISPSLFEPFGITLLDAALLGVPIVATQHTGALEIFSRGSVEITAPQDSKELSKKIIHLLTNRRRREKMAELARRDVMHAPGWTEIARRVEKNYLRLL